MVYGKFDVFIPGYTKYPTWPKELQNRSYSTSASYSSSSLRETKEARGHKVNIEDGLHNKPIDLEKLFTPTSDSGEITPRNSEGQGQEPETENNRPPLFNKEAKPPPKLVKNSTGKIQDINMLRKQGYVPEPVPLSQEVCFDLVRDAPKGKGAELFAKRRQKSENWVIDENNVKTPETVMTQSPVSKLPSPSYLKGSAQRVENVQKMNKIQERFAQPRLKLIKSPWEAALEGSVENAFQELRKSPRGYVNAPTPTALKHLATPPPPSPPVTPDLYKPKTPRAWHPQPTYKTLSNEAPKPSTPYVSQQSHSEQPITQAQPYASLSYSNMNNYNTAPRGWQKSMSHYKPVIFNQPATYLH